MGGRVAEAETPFTMYKTLYHQRGFESVIIIIIILYVYMC